MTDTKELVEQLRSGIDNVDGNEYGGIVLTMKEAATTIESQAAYIERLEGSLKEIDQYPYKFGVHVQKIKRLAHAALQSKP